MDELLDILEPPLFTKSGRTKTREQAYDDGDWVGTFNLWIVQRQPVPALVYQIRGPKKAWAPGKLDVPVGGHYLAGETMTDGLREVQEELGKDYNAKDLVYLGRKLFVGHDRQKRRMHNVVDVYLVEDDAPLTSYTLQRDEVYAVCSCPIDDLLKVHADPDYTFKTQRLTADGDAKTITVKAESFPKNWDNYHLKIAQLAKRYLAGEKDLAF